MVSVNALIEKLLDSPGVGVTEAAEQLLAALSENRLCRDEFISDPSSLIGPPFYASRYLAQVVLRSFNGEYDAVEEILAVLTSLIDRKPPILEARRGATATRVVLPEAKILDLRYPAKN